MCIETAIRADIRVSVQDRAAPDRAAGHLATGVLVDGDLVLVPDPPERLFDPALDLEVLIFPAGPAERLPVEAPPVWKWGRFAVGDREPLAATAKLGRPSVYSAQIGRADAAALADAAERTGGLWAALREQGVLVGEVDAVDADLLRRAGELERAQREPRRAAHRFDSTAALTDGLCILFCFCEPHGPR
ncbi:hypothetical protein [Micromonospora auratinigra]|uniref:Uncharacterized protein n=1 Tax=Micromonospora auratinigra TaxID=261654 RepID=A0A1A8ZD84_9ACTN|nr:hypothetical protein [Micromonospora auratinigra]SBT41960.1 hypothetical protein GA0070611_1811 [Micromonospora auratinigra]